MEPSPGFPAVASGSAAGETHTAGRPALKARSWSLSLPSALKEAKDLPVTLLAGWTKDRGDRCTHTHTYKLALCFIEPWHSLEGRRGLPCWCYSSKEVGWAREVP